MAWSWLASMAIATVLSPGAGTAAQLESGIGRAAQKRAQALEHEWTQELNSQPAKPRLMKKHSPIKRVVTLLREMKAQLESEAKKDEKLYHEMVCWCETTGREKKDIMKKAEAKIAALTDEIETRSAKHGKYEEMIHQNKVEVARGTESMQKAQAMRKGEASTSHLSIQQLTQSIISCQAALVVLSKQEASFLQVGSPLLTSMRTVLRDLALKHELSMASLSDRIHTRRGTSLLAVSSRATRITNMQESGARSNQQNQLLLDALDIGGADLSTDLPVQFAQQELQRALTGLPKASSAFLQTGVVQPNTYHSYSSHAGTVVGILEQMLEDFKRDLQDTKRSEQKAKEEYEGLTEAKDREERASEANLEETETEHAHNYEAVMIAGENVMLAREERGAASDFLVDMSATCKSLDVQYAERRATRNEEIAAVADAIAILSEDNNREHLAATVTFMQVNAAQKEGSHMMRLRRSRAASRLRQASQDLAFADDDLLADAHSSLRLGARNTASIHSPRAQLDELETAVELDAFTKAKELMDKIVANLKEQHRKEVKFKAYCKKEFKANGEDTVKATGTRDDLKVDIGRMRKSIDESSQAVQEAKARIAKAELEIKKASQDRESENKDFQITLADQYATQDILHKALDRLKEFYGANEAAMLQQAAKRAHQPKQFSPYKANDGVTTAINLMEKIIHDSEVLAEEAQTSESKSQAEYEDFVKVSNDEIAALKDAVNSKSRMKADAEYDLSDATNQLEITNQEVEALEKYEADLHAQCDFILKNFNVRQKARLKEIESIHSAKAILAGAK